MPDSGPDQSSNQTELLGSYFTMKKETDNPITPETQPGKPNVSGDGEYDALAIENLRMDQAELDRPAVKPALLSIPIRKPDRLEFIRVRPGENYRVGPVPFIELRGRGETYLVDPRFRPELKPREYWIVEIFLATNRLAKLFLWVVKLQSPTGRVSDWYNSQLDCAERAMTDWIQIVADQEAGVYTVVAAEDQLEEPEYPEQSMQDLIRLGFKRRIVDSLDHPVMKQLRGKR
jgi:hypothetical protein